MKWLNIFWWFLAVITLSFGLWGNYYYPDIETVWRVLAWMVLAALLTVFIFQTVQGNNFYSLVKQSWCELQKVVWPTRRETVQVTMIVMLIVFVTALLLWGIDTFLMWLMSKLTG